MSTVSIILLVLCAVLTALLSVSIYFNIKHGMIILRIQDALENSLDVLDSRYKSISSILEIPVFFDSLEVRQVMLDIEKSRDSILYVANALTESTTDKGENENDTEAG